MKKQEALAALDKLRGVIERLPEYAQVSETSNFESVLVFGDRAEFEAVAMAMGKTVTNEEPEYDDDVYFPVKQHMTYEVDGILMSGWAYNKEVLYEGLPNAE